MSGTFSGIEIASRALRTDQVVIDVIGHNVANVNTPGYTRQSAAVVSTAPDYGPGSPVAGVLSQLGTGVDVASITRVRDAFLDGRLAVAHAQQGEADQLRDALARIQNVYQEPGDSGLNTQLAAFFNSFQELSRQPENASQRFIVRNQAETLVSQFHSLSAEFVGIDRDLAGKIGMTLQSANDIAKQVADLNKQIHDNVATGQQPNDLEDHRAELVRQLGELTGARGVEEVDAAGKRTGYVNVSVGGYPLVQGDLLNALPLTTGTIDGLPAIQDGSDFYPLNGGEVAGILKSRDLLAGYRAGLDTLASALIGRVNAQHQAGYGLDGQTGRSFFAGSDAATITVDPTIESSLDAIAAATPPAVGQPVASGNGDNARAIADLMSVPAVGASTFGEAYSALVVQAGADASSATRESTARLLQKQQVENLRESVSGVSLDEELAKMLQFQRSYQAAARLLTAMDEMIGRVIDSIGTTG